MENHEQRFWPAVTIALFGVIAGYVFINFPDGPSPTADNYFLRRSLREYVQGGLAVVTMLAPLIALGAGIIRRSLFGSFVAVLALAFAMIWVPGNLRACCGGDEAAMIGVMRSINSAQQAYTSSCANDKGYASSLETLATPPVPGSSPFIFPGIAGGLWRGYRVTMTTPDDAVPGFVACDGKSVVRSYFAEAHLIDAIEGRRSFATDERGVVYSKQDGSIIQPGMEGAEPVQ